MTISDGWVADGGKRVKDKSPDERGSGSKEGGAYWTTFTEGISIRVVIVVCCCSRVIGK